jgi:hypothetical protein
MKTFCGLSHWQWSQWQYDRRMAYQRTFSPEERVKNDEYFIRNISEYTKKQLLNKSVKVK